jgi:mannosyltransferase OCH1-like enzyme
MNKNKKMYNPYFLTLKSSKMNMKFVETIRKKEMLTQTQQISVQNTRYPMKESYNSIIPLNIFQTWHTKILPPLMQESVTIIKKVNPKFNYYLFDDKDCREFIKNNFDKDVLYAFDTLVPGAYKADLWRYCVLYKKGGIYLDIKYRPYNGFQFINLTEKEHLVLDADGAGIYNALMVCLPNNEMLLKAIHQIVNNVKTRYYGKNFLEPTGPKLLWKLLNEQEKQSLDMTHKLHFSVDNRFIYLGDYPVLKSYNGYITEHHICKKNEHYSTLWRKKKIYKYL